MESEFDFKNAISKLDKKAKSCRTRLYTVCIVLLIVTVAFAAWIFVSFTQANSLQSQAIRMSLSQGAASGKNLVQAPFIRQIQGVMDEKIGKEETGFLIAFISDNDKLDKFTPPTSEREKELNAILTEAFANLERARDLFKNEKDPAPKGTDWGYLVSSGIFSLGAIGLMVVMLKISIMFMRYYARLAELYEAQADALRASNGDVEKAYKFLEHFSPNAIEINNAPVTLYEKALETIGSVANKKP
ncbi:TPA: hypothetical protein ACPJ2O_004617 [Vibrio diabolicus]